MLLYSKVEQKIDNLINVYLYFQYLNTLSENESLLIYCGDVRMKLQAEVSGIRYQFLLILAMVQSLILLCINKETDTLSLHHDPCLFLSFVSISSFLIKSIVV